MSLRDHLWWGFTQGYSMIPLQPNSKKPAVSWKPFIAQTPTNEQYREWRDKGLFKTGYGIVTGKVSGISVLDVDFKNDGMESLAEHDIDVISLFTRMVDSPNGRHYYFAYDPKARQGAERFGKGVDIRNDGGFIVGPGSVVEGKEYRWAFEHGPDEVDLQPVPEWLKQAPGNRMEKSPVTFEDMIKDGERNTKLSSLAGKLFAAKLPRGAVLGALEYVNEKYTVTPVEQDELVYIFNSIGRYHAE